MRAAAASPSLWEGRKRGFASFRGGALRERVERRKLKGEEEKRTEQTEEKSAEWQVAWRVLRVVERRRSVTNRATSNRATSNYATSNRVTTMRPSMAVSDRDN